MAPANMGGGGVGGGLMLLVSINTYLFRVCEVSHEPFDMFRFSFRRFSYF